MHEVTKRAARPSTRTLGPKYPRHQEGSSTMPRIAPSNTGRTPMERLMGHAPHILGPWTKLEDAFFASKTFSPALLEQVRRTLALSTGCRYCQAKGGPRSHACRFVHRSGRGACGAL